MRSHWFRAYCPGCRGIDKQAEIVREVLRQSVATLGGEIKPAAAGTAGCGLQYLRFVLRHHHQLLTDCP